MKAEDGKDLAAGTSVWFIIDLEKRKPVRLEYFEKIFFSIPDLHAMDTAAGKIDSPESFGIEKDLQIRKSDLDLNGHVNNIHYAEWICNIPDSFLESSGAQRNEINYLAETFYGDPIRVYTHLDDSFANIQSFRVSDKAEVCRARTVWQKV